MASNKVTLETGAWFYGAHRTCAETASVSRGINLGLVTTKQRCKYTTLVGIQKHAVLSDNRSDSQTTKTQWVAPKVGNSCHCKALRVHLETGAREVFI